MKIRELLTLRELPAWQKHLILRIGVALLAATCVQPATSSASVDVHLYQSTSTSQEQDPGDSIPLQPTHPESELITGAATDAITIIGGVAADAVDSTVPQFDKVKLDEDLSALYALNCAQVRVGPNNTITELHCVRDKDTKQPLDPNTICIGTKKTLNLTDMKHSPDGGIVCGPIEIDEIMYDPRFPLGLAVLTWPEFIQGPYAYLAAAGDSPLTEGQAVNTGGWGREGDGTATDRKKEATLRAHIEPDACDSPYILPLIGYYIRAGDGFDSTRDGDPIEGPNLRDSGGALYVPTSNRRNLVYGVTATVTQLAQPVFDAAGESIAEKCSSFTNTHATANQAFIEQHLSGQILDGLYADAEVAINYTPTSFLPGNTYQFKSTLVELVDKAWSVPRASQYVEKENPDGTFSRTNDFTVRVSENGAFRVVVNAQLSTTQQYRFSAEVTNRSRTEFKIVTYNLVPMDTSFLPMIQGKNQ